MKTKDRISEDEWNSGSSTSTDAEKARKVLEVLAKVGRGGLSMKAIGRETGITWPYTTVNNLRDIGTVERNKIGKAFYFRLVKS